LKDAATSSRSSPENIVALSVPKYTTHEIIDITSTSIIKFVQF